jgi:outer membrane protein assembly factor BamB
MEKKFAGIIFSLLFFFAPFTNIMTQTPPKEITRDGTPDWWPMYGHDVRHTGFSSSPAPETNTTLYGIQLLNTTSNTTVFSGPTIVNGKLYLSSNGVSGSELMCADALNGTLLWNVSLGGDVYFSPTIADGKLYQFGENLTENLTTFLSCYDAENGSLIWSFPIPNADRIRSPPVISAGKIYFGTYTDGILYCLSSTNGTELWSIDTNHSFGGIQASPAFDDGRLYAVATNTSAGPSEMFCVNATNGSILWTFSTENGPGRAPTVMNNSVFVGAGDTMYCLDAMGNGNGTTTILWQSTVPGSVSSSSLAYGNIYFSSTNGRVYSVNTSTGAPVWSYFTNGTPTSPVLAENKLYVASYETNENLSYSYGYTYCLDALGDGNDTTHVIWQAVLPDHNVVGSAQPAIALSTIWIATNNNWVYAFSDNLPPVQPATPTGPTQGYTEILYNFSATTTDPNMDNISYMWSWGDGTYTNWSVFVPSGSLFNASHAWDVPGNYTVLVRARDELGHVTNWSDGLFVVIYFNNFPPVQPGMPTGPTQGYTDVDYTYFAVTTDPDGDNVSYMWSWGDGTYTNWSVFVPSGSLFNASHAWDVPGNYTVLVRARDELGHVTNWSDGLFVVIYFNNFPPVQPGMPTGPTQGYTDVDYTYFAVTTDPDGDNVSYMWSWGDGTYTNWSEFVPSGSLFNASHAWNVSENYTVAVKARDVYGYETNWSDGLMVEIVPYYPLVVDAGGPYLGNVGDVIHFNGSSSGGAPPYHWHWDFGDGNSSEIQNATHVYQTAGQFAITLTITDALSYTASGISTATIIPLPQPELVIRNITGGFGINAVIQNIGDADATNVSWNITLKGGFIFLGNRTAARVTRIQPGQDVSLKSSLIIGLGRSTITVFATCNEGVSTKKETYGFVILIFVFGVE